MLLKSINWDPAGCRHLFSSVSKLLVSQWTTPLNELMSRSGSSLKTNPRISPFSYQLLRGACVTLQNIQIWCQSIREVTFTPVKTTTPGRPRMTSSEANVKNIFEVNPRMSAREILNNLLLPRSTVYRILKAHLNFRNIYSVLVPHVLSDVNIRQQIQC